MLRAAPEICVAPASICPKSAFISIAVYLVTSREGGRVRRSAERVGDAVHLVLLLGVGRRVRDAALVQLVRDVAERVLQVVRVLVPTHHQLLERPMGVALPGAAELLDGAGQRLELTHDAVAYVPNMYGC